MDTSSILEQLKKEHTEVRELFKKAESCHEDQRSALVKKIKKELIPHARGEEKTVYSLLKEILHDEKSSKENIDLINEAYEEHRVIDDLFKTLESVNTSDERWPAHLKVLKENIEHHIKEEETDLFKLIRKNFSEQKLVEIKALYMDVKQSFSETMPSQAQIKERQPSSVIHL